MAILQKFLKWTLIFGSVGVLLYVGFIFYAGISFGGAFDSHHTKEELIENYSKRHTEIHELKSYFNSITPNNTQVEIEYKSNSKLFRFGVSTMDSATGTRIYPIFLEWDLKTNSDKVDSVIKTIGWNQQTLKEIKRMLDKANCIQIESGEPTKIGWQRSGMGMYVYNLFDKPIPDSLQGRYNDSCTYILYNNQVVLEYSGGAIGPNCFTKH